MIRRLDRPLLLVLALALAAAAAFLASPDLDLAVAARFYGPDGFLGRVMGLEWLRWTFYAAPFAIGLVPLVVWARGLRRGGPRRVSGAAALWLVGAMAAGPGLLVNGVLKEVSHRPRPAQIVPFGGTETFRPFGRFDGTCRANCSFVSGEASTSAWTLAPALLTPAPWRAAAAAASLGLAFATGGLRMAMGAHFLSDVVFGWLLTWAIVLASRPRALRPPE
jgi:membrane-associated PAP2 superfamily phosphatase